jgi:hypothetical protein
MRGLTNVYWCTGGWEGFETVAFSPGKSPISDPGNVENNVTGAPGGPTTIDPDPAALIAAWASLSRAEKESILRIVGRATVKTKRS